MASAPAPMMPFDGWYGAHPERCWTAGAMCNPAILTLSPRRIF